MVMRLTALTIVATALLAAFIRPEPASACSVPDGFDPFTDATAVVDGLVLSAGPYPEPFAVLVQRLYHGRPALVTTFITSPTTCSLDGLVRAGDHIVIGLYSVNGTTAGTWPTLVYSGPPAGEEYERSLAMATDRFGGGSFPLLPEPLRGWWGR